MVHATTDFRAVLVHNTSTFSLDVEFAPKQPTAQSARLKQQMQQILVAMPLLNASAPAALKPDVATSFNPCQHVDDFGG